MGHTAKTGMVGEALSAALMMTHPSLARAAVADNTLTVTVAAFTLIRSTTVSIATVNADYQPILVKLSIVCSHTYYN